MQKVEDKRLWTYQNAEEGSKDMSLLTNIKNLLGIFHLQKGPGILHSFLKISFLINFIFALQISLIIRDPGNMFLRKK